MDPRQLVSSKQLGEVLGLTERRVQQLEAESILINVGKGRNKRYRLADAVQAVLAKSEADARAAIADASTSREMFEAERARKLKLENDKREALLVQTPSALAAIDVIVGHVAGALEQLPSQLSEDVGERRRIENVIDNVRADLARRLEQAGAALEEGRDPLEAAEAVDA